MTRSVAARAAVMALTIVGAAGALVFGFLAASDLAAYDAHAYWAANPATAYTLPEGSPDALLYAPPLVILFSAIGAVVPWPVFVYAWTLAESGSIAFMAGPFTLPLILTFPIATEIKLANVHALMGLAIIAGFRWPATWSVLLLTKVTPGVGLLWFAFRREWRSLAIALGVTAAICLPTMVLAPDLWARWIGAILDNHGGPPLVSGLLATPLWARLALAVVVLWWGARRDATWVVPIAATLGLPVLWDHGLAIALASIWLAMHPRWPASARSGAVAPAPVVGQAGVVTQ
jgi:hypothetical protein